MGRGSSSQVTPRSAHASAKFLARVKSQRGASFTMVTRHA